MFFPRNIRIYDNTKIFTAFYPFNIFTIDYQFQVQILQLGFSCTKYAIACFCNIKAQFVSNKPICKRFELSFAVHSTYLNPSVVARHPQGVIQIFVSSVNIPILVFHTDQWGHVQCGNAIQRISTKINGRPNSSTFHFQQEALLLQRNRATRYVSLNIMAVF